MWDKTSYSVILKPQTLHWIVNLSTLQYEQQNKARHHKITDRHPRATQGSNYQQHLLPGSQAPVGTGSTYTGMFYTIERLLLTQSHADVTGLLPLSAPTFTFIKTLKQSIAQHLELCDIPPRNVSCDYKMLLSLKRSKAKLCADSECPLLLLLKTVPKLARALTNQKANSSSIFCEPTCHCK